MVYGGRRDGLEIGGATPLGFRKSNGPAAKPIIQGFREPTISRPTGGWWDPCFAGAVFKVEWSRQDFTMEWV